MDGNPFNVRDVGWGRIAPLFSPRELAHAVQLGPSLSSVAASKKQWRLRARIDNHPIARVECQRKYLAFLQSLRLPGAVASIIGYSDFDYAPTIPISPLLEGCALPRANRKCVAARVGGRRHSFML